LPSGSISSGIGNRLREARIARNLSIEEIAWRTRIRPEYLRALESEQFADLGHHAFVRTHLHSYATLLGLDAAEVSDAFRDVHEPEGPSPLETLNLRQREVRRQRPKLSWFRAALVAGVALIVAASVGALRGPGSGSSAGGLPSNPRIDAPQQASRDVRLDKPVRAAAEVAPALVTLEITAVNQAWVRVAGDGQLLFEGVLAAGETRSFTAGSRIDVQARSVEALRLTVAGAPFAPGVRGAWSGSFGPSGPVDSR
jgi:transcriptional regulator with XRE-family HTH domain